jgi:hypothetical protein
MPLWLSEIANYTPCKPHSKSPRRREAYAALFLFPCDFHSQYLPEILFVHPNGGQKRQVCDAYIPSNLEVDGVQVQVGG